MTDHLPARAQEWSRGWNRVRPGIAAVGGAVLLLGGVLPLPVASAQEESATGPAIGPGPHATVEWLIEAPLVPGTFTRTAVLFQIEDGWHTYGKTQNDTGFPARFEPVLPRGIEVVSEAWPTPERHVSPGGILDHVYEHETAIFLDLFVSPTTAPGQVDLGLKVDWLVCREACVFEGDSLTVTATVSTPMALIPHTTSPRTAAYAARLPRPLPPESGVTIERIGTPGGAVAGAGTGGIGQNDSADRVRITVPGAEELTFFPALEGAPLTRAIEDGSVRGTQLDLHIEPKAGGLAGILEVRRPGGTDFFRIP